MKKFLTDSKRILTGVLASLLVLTSVPEATIISMAAPEKDEIIYEDVQDVVENDAASEEVVEEGSLVEESVDPDFSTNDVTIWLSNVSGSSSDNTKHITANIDVYLDNTSSTLDVGSRVAFDSDDKFDNTSGAVRSSAASDTADTTVINTADSENDFSFYMVAKEGYEWPADATTKIAKVWYGNYDTTAKSAVPAGGYIPTTITGEKLITAPASAITATPVDWNDSVRKITIDKSVLQDVVLKSKCSDTTAAYAPAVLVVQIGDLTDSDLATATIPTISYTGCSIKSGNEITSDMLKVKYNATATGTAAVTIAGVGDSVEDITLAADMITVTYTPLDGEAVTFTGSATAISNPTIATSNTSGTVQYVGKNLLIAQNLINAFVLGEGTLTIKIDGSSASKDLHALTVNPASSTYFKIGKNADYTTAMPTTIKKENTAFTFYAEPTATLEGSRTISITAKEVNDGTDLTIAESPAKTFTIAASDVNTIDDDVEITVKAYQTVDGATYVSTGADNHAAAFTTEGAAIGSASQTAEAGKNFSFKVRTDAGYKVATVGYYLGRDKDNVLSTTESTDEKTGETIYTTAGEITDGIALVVTTTKINSSWDITVDTATATATSSPNTTRIYAGTDLTTTDGTASTITTSTNKNATANEPFFFTVYKGTNNEVKSATYKMGTAAAVSAVLVSDNGTSAVYKIPNVTANTVISVVMSTSIKIVKPVNNKVSVDFNTASNGVTSVASTNDFYFSVTPAEGVTLGAVKYIIANNADGTGSPESPVTLTKQADGRYKIPSTAFTGKEAKYVTLYAETYELVTTGYTVTWAVAGETPKVPTSYPKLVNTYAADGETITAQELNLVYLETTGYLSAKFTSTAKGNANLGTADYGKTTLGTASAPDGDALVAGSYAATDADGKNIILIDDTTDAQAVVTGNKLGTDTITAQVTKTNATTGHTLVYQGTLDVTVTPAYKDLELATTTGGAGWTSTAAPVDTIHVTGDATTTSESNETAVFTLIGTNVRTGVVSALSHGVNGVTISKWSFDPDNTIDNPRNWLMAPGNSINLATATASTLTNGNGVAVATKVAGPIKVAVTAKQNGETTGTTYNATVTAIADARYLPYPTVQVTNGTKYEGVTAVSGTHTGNGTGIALEADPAAGSLNSADLTFDVYKAKSATAPVGISTSAALKSAKEAEEVTLASGANITYVVENRKGGSAVSADETEYITVTPGTDGKYTITAKKAFPTTIDEVKVTFTTKIDNVIVGTQDVYFTVKAKFAKGTVYLKLDNTNEKDTAGDVVKQVLTSTSYTGRTNSIYEDNNNGVTGVNVAGNRGIKFTAETINGVFTLPVQSDFDSTKIGVGNILLGWSNTGSTNYYKPGAEVSIASSEASNTYVALWAKEYSWPTGEVATGITGADIKAQNGNGLVIYNGNTANTDSNNKITAAKAFSTMTNNATTITAATTGSIAYGGTMPVVLKLTHRKAIEENFTVGSKTLITETEESLFVNADSVSLSGEGDDNHLTVSGNNTLSPKNANAYTAKVVASATLGEQTFQTVPVSVSITAAPTTTVTLADASALVGEKDKFMTATLSSSGHSGDYKWTWTSSDPTVATIANRTKVVSGIYGTGDELATFVTTELGRTYTAANLGVGAGGSYVLYLLAIGDDEVPSGNWGIEVSQAGKSSLYYWSNGYVKASGKQVGYTVILMDKSDFDTNSYNITAPITVTPITYDATWTEPSAGVKPDDVTYFGAPETLTFTTANTGAYSATSVAEVTALKAGTATITATAVDKNNISISKEATLTVTAADVDVKVVDSTGAEVSKIYAQANYDATSDPTDSEFSLSVPNGVNNLEVVKGDGAVVTSEGGEIEANNNIRVKTADSALSDKGSLVISYVYNGSTFEKVIPVETYYTITLDAGSGNTITKDGAEYKVNNATQQTVKVRVNLSNQKEVKNSSGTVTGYEYKDISLGGYEAKSAVTGKVFKDWNGAAATDVYTATIAGPITQTTVGHTAGTALKAGNFNLVAEYQDQPITRITTDDTITLVNDNTPATGSVNAKTLNIVVEPAATREQIFIVPDKTTIFSIVGSSAGSLATMNTTNYSSGNVLVTATSATGTPSVRTDVYKVGAITENAVPTDRRAGTVKLLLNSGSATGTTLQTVTLNINGYDSYDEAYWQDGVKLTDTIKTISAAGTATVTWYFGADGKRVTGTKIITRADGTKMLIKSGEIPTAGKTNAILDGETASKTYVIGAEGKIQTGWLKADYSAATGVSDGVYYVDPETGDMLAGTLKEIGGKTYYFQASGVLAKATSAASDFEKIGNYYVNAAGEVAIAGIFKVESKDRLFREDGTIVKHDDSDVKDGKLQVGDTIYVIKDDDTAEPDHKHDWGEPVWAWTPKDTGVPTAAVATFTCSVGKETKNVDAVITSEKSGEYTDYTAKVTFEEKEYTDVITLDAEGNRVAKHTHDWKTDKKWTWDPATGVPTTASLTFTCTVGEKPESKIVTGSAVAGTPNKKGAIKYTVEITGLDGKPYSTSKTIDASGQEISGDYNFEDDAEEDGTFTASFEGDENEFVYTGSAIKPNVIVNNGEKTLVNGVDYTLSYKNNINAGTGATVTVKGKGLYTSSLDLNFTITKASIAEAAIGNLAYKTGTASDKIKPTANYKGKALKLGTDFTIKSMGDLDSATNTQTMIIAGAGNNFDSESEQEVTITYAAKPAKISATINVAKSYDYTGEEVLSMDDLRDLVTVAGLAEGANFYVTAGDLVNAGTCKIAVTADGFTGTKTASFKINPAKNATFTVTNAEDLTTTGTNFKVTGATPFVAVNAKISDTIDYDLVLGKDYKVTYSKNKDAGTGTATINFLGNYKGATKVTQTFKINKANLDDATVAVADFVKGKNAAFKAYKATPDKKLFVQVGGMQIKKSEYAVTYKQGETTLTDKTDITFEDGVATITVEIAPSAKAKNIEAGTTPLTGEYKVFESAKGTDVSKGKVSVVEIGGSKAAKVGYTGTEITFAQDNEDRQGDLSLKIGKTVVNAKDIEEHFDITYVNNVAKGTATIVLTAKDGDETYTGSATGTFKIGAHVFVKAKDLKD